MRFPARGSEPGFSVRKHAGPWPVIWFATLVACSAPPDGDDADGGEAGPPCELVRADGTLVPFYEAWPCIVPGVESRSFSSFDRKGGDDDGFFGTYSSLYTDVHGHFVIFDALGPGRLDTLWFTTSYAPLPPLGLGAIRLYLDDAPAPVVTIDANDLFRGDVAPFLTPLVANNHVSSGGFVSWLPVPFARRLVITTENKPSFYFAAYERFPPDWRVVSSFPGSEAAALATRFREALEDRPPVDAETVPLDTTREGSGVVELLRFTPRAPLAGGGTAGGRIRIWWDGEAEPSVDCPIGDFFGTGLGQAEVRALGFTGRDGVYENHFPMPFWSQVRVEVTGIEGTLAWRVEPQRYLPGEAGAFHARYLREFPTTTGRDFIWLEASGAGKVVGTVLTVEPRTSADVHWWEGDMRTFVDGLRSPSINGTGHEDDHLGGWSTEFLSMPFTLPMNGEPKSEILWTEPPLNGKSTMYRLWPGLTYLADLAPGPSTWPGSLKILLDF